MKLFDKYRLIRELSHDGGGVIWLACDEESQREVAVKVLPEINERDVPKVEAFMREFVTMMRISNLHVAQVLDVGVDANVPFVAMELLKGQSLAALLSEHKPLPVKVFSPIFLQATRALEAIHKVGLVHYGIRPTSIFLARRDVEQVVKIIGFSNPFVDPQRGNRLDLTDEDCRLDEPQYMSPEQVMDTDTDYRTDLWSLGVVAYESLTGQPPFAANVLTAVLMRICQLQHAPPSSLAKGLGPGVDAFFARALAKDPARRFDSAAEMAASFTTLVMAAP